MDADNAYIYAIGHTPIEQVNLSTGAVSYLMSDLLGSVRGIVDSTDGSLTASTAYDAWGNPESTGGLTSITPFGFTGSYTDQTGLVYLIHRYFDPVTGQFVSVDPAVGTTGQPYAYAYDDPVNDGDPLGLGCGLFAVVCNAATQALGAVEQHWRGITQVATVAASGLGSAACIAATDGICALALPLFGEGTAVAFYGESSGPHTLNGFLQAAAEGGIGGGVAFFCTAGGCEVAGSVAVGGVLVNGLWGAGQGLWDYENSDVCHTAGGYAFAGTSGFAQGGIPWDEIWNDTSKFIRGGE